MADENDLVQGQRVDDFQQVGGIAFEAGVAALVPGFGLGMAAAGVVEQHDAVAGLESRGDEAPDLLVAAEAMGEDEGAPALAAELHVVASQDVGLHRCGFADSAARGKADCPGAISIKTRAAHDGAPRIPWFAEGEFSDCRVRAGRLAPTLRPQFAKFAWRGEWCKKALR